jgi:hypothetical protein
MPVVLHKFSLMDIAFIIHEQSFAVEVILSPFAFIA